MKQGAVIKIISWVLIVLTLVAGVGAIAYFTGGFTGEFKTFYINVDGKDILTSASDYKHDTCCTAAYSRHRRHCLLYGWIYRRV